MAKRIEVPEETQLQMVDLYVGNKYGCEKIGKITGYCKSVVKRILKEHNIILRNYQEAQLVKTKTDTRKYPINDDYCLESHNGAWLLGFLAADGYLPKTKNAIHRIVLSLQRQDEDSLKLIAKEIDFKGPIIQYIAQEQYKISSLSFSSEKLRQKIESYGIINNKTFLLNDLPSLPKEYVLDFIRGYFDGDGSVYEPSDHHKIRMSLCSVNESFLQNIVNFLNENYNIPKVTIHKRFDKKSTVPLYYFIYNTNSSFQLGKLFYFNNYLSLIRKKNKFLDIYSKYYN